MAKSKGLKIGIDLGTVNTLVYVSSRGIIFNEPSVIAFDTESGNTIAVGHEAKAMVGKTHDRVRVIKPLSQGAISDKKSAMAFLGYIIETIAQINKSNCKDSTILICCHSDLSQIERNALRDLALSFGVNDVLVEEEVKAGAVGAGIDIFRAEGAMVIDIGGGSTDIGVLALGDLVASRSIKVAGNFFDTEITKYIKMKHNFEIGPTTAERIKLNLISVREVLEDEKTMDIAGRDLRTGLPSQITIKQSEVRDVVRKIFYTICGEVLKVLEQTPPEISSDIINNGIVLNGGGALIDGAKEFFEEELHLDVKLSADPLTAIVQGTIELLKNRGNYLVRPHD